MWTLCSLLTDNRINLTIPPSGDEDFAKECLSYQHHFDADSMRYSIFLWLGLFLGLVQELTGQQEKYIRYTMADGLPTNYVYGVVEDDEGYIWAYTENGLAKFDSYEFKVYTTADGLPDNDVVQAIMDKQGRIWLHTYRGEIAYWSKDSIVVYGNQYGNPVWIQKSGAGQVKLRTTTGFYQSTAGEHLEQRTPLVIDALIWEVIEPYYHLDTILPADTVQQEQILFLRDLRVDHHQGGKIRQYRVHKKLVFDELVGIYYSSLPAAGEYCLSLPKLGKLYLHREGKTLSFEVPKITASTTSPYVSPDGDYVLLQEGKGRFVWVDLKTGGHKTVDFSNWVTDLDEGLIHYLSPHFIEGEVQFSYSGGLFRLNREGAFLEHLVFEELRQDFELLNSTIDRKGNIWIGSRDGGLFFLPVSRRNAVPILPEDKQLYSYDYIIPTLTGDVLAYSYYAQLFELQGKRLHEIWAPAEAQRSRGIAATDLGVLISGGFNGQMLEHRSGDWLVQPFGQRYSSQLVNEYPGFTNLRNIFNFVYDRTSSELITVYMGRIVSAMRISAAGSMTVTQSFLYSQAEICAGQSGGVWVTNATEVSRYEKGKMCQVAALPFESNVTSMYASGRYLWLGSQSDGLWRMDTSGQQLQQLAPYRHIYTIRPGYEEGTLLLSTQEGLVVWQIDPAGGYAREHYTTNDGLPLNEVRDAVAVDARYLYLATYKGIWRIDRQYQQQQAMRDQDFSWQGIWVNGQQIPVDNQLDLAYDQNDLSIHYRLLHYASAGNITYHTKLEPAEEVWQTSKERSRNYLNLASGTYRFLAKATNGYGQTLSMTPLPIEIRPAWWQRRITRFLAVFLLLMTLSVILWRRDQRQRAEYEVNKALDERIADLQLSALRAQMNPHFVFNALGAIQYFIQVSDVEAADAYLTRFAKLMRKYLNSSRERLITLSDEIELLTLYTELEELRFEDKFRTHFHLSENINPASYYLPSMLLQPLVENAIIHGLNERDDGQGRLDILFTTTEDQELCCTIQDNGIGREKSAQNKRIGHQSKGMHLIKDRIDTLEASGVARITIAVTDAFPQDLDYKGTKVCIYLKLKDDE